MYFICRTNNEIENYKVTKLYLSSCSLLLAKCTPTVNNMVVDGICDEKEWRHSIVYDKQSQLYSCFTYVETTYIASFVVSTKCGELSTCLTILFILKVYKINFHKLREYYKVYTRKWFYKPFKGHLKLHL